MRLARGLLAALFLAISPAARADTVTVFAAASLREVVGELGRQFEAATGHRVVVSYSATNALARQIDAGAPAEVFISADAEWVDYVETKQRTVPGSRRELVGNELVLVAPSASSVSLAIAPGFALRPALGDRRLALANPEAVPAGMYAKAALQSLGVWESVRDRLAPGESVRAALAFVAMREAPLGIVYRTDAYAEPAVKILGRFPPDSHPRIAYYVVAIKGAKPPALAFAAHLANPQSRVTWRKHGFITGP
jgi:molybdate transport system substrate-binding protein